jgi:alpha-beta hydrolase superfamily lysophospholipase
MIESMIFFPEKTLYEKPEDYGFQYEEVTMTTEDKVDIFGWYVQAPKLGEKGTILFFHGNAGNISNRLYKIKGWIDRGFSVFLVDYRGYGRSQGAIRHSNDVLKDAAAALDWLTEQKKLPLPKIVLYGESLGTYPAIRLGAEHPVAALILEAPFTSLYDVAKIHYSFVVKPLMQSFEFSNMENIANVRAPVFILHGNRDEICPYAMAGELFEHAPEPKGFLSVPDGMHNDLPVAAGEDFWQKPYEFLVKNAGFPD